MPRHVYCGPLERGRPEINQKLKSIELYQCQGKGERGRERRETRRKSSSERPEIKRGLSGRSKRNEERQRCEVGGERPQLQTTAEINMTQPAPHCRDKVILRWGKCTEKW